VTDPRPGFATFSDDDLAEALRDVGRSVAFPPPYATTPDAVDLAARVRQRLEISPPRPSIWQRLPRPIERNRAATRIGRRSAPRGLVLALIALLVLAAVAGAVGLGLPGLRIIFGQGPSVPPSASASTGPTPSTSAESSPSPSPAPPLGSSLALGIALPFADVERQAGFDLLLPTDPDLGAPDAAYLNGARAAFVWATRPGLPETERAGVGLVLNEFRGTVDEGYFQKILDQNTILTRVTVAGSRGYWITGSPHFFFYVDPDGNSVTDEHDIVGDVLMWTKDDVTYRLETSLGMAAAIRLAESLR
jgi:hypothetical protein